MFDVRISGVTVSGSCLFAGFSFLLLFVVVWCCFCIMRGFAIFNFHRVLFISLKMSNIWFRPGNICADLQ